MRKTFFPLFAATAVLAACAPAPDMENFVDDKAPAARVTGEAVSCLSIARIKDTDVHSDYTIDFETTGNDLYRVTIPNKCPGLGFEERFSYSTSLTQLCSSDIITVLDSNGNARGSCGMSEFVPIELIED